MGSSIASGILFSNKIFYHPPLYSYYLGLLYSLFSAKPYIAYVSQVLLGILNLFLIYLITVKLTNKNKAGYAAMILALFYAPFSFIETKLYATTLGISLSLLSLYMLIQAIEKRNKNPVSFFHTIWYIARIWCNRISMDQGQIKTITSFMVFECGFCHNDISFYYSISAPSCAGAGNIFRNFCLILERKI